MNFHEYENQLLHVQALQENAKSVLDAFTESHDPKWERYPDDEAARWTDTKRAQRQRFTTSEVNEIREQAAAQVAQQRQKSRDDLNRTRATIEVRATALEAYSERLQPLWTQVPQRTDDATRATLRMADELAAKNVLEECNHASWTLVEQRYQAARDNGDHVAMRVIEAALRGEVPMTASNPSTAEIGALYHLLHTVRETQRSRHPEEANKLRATIAEIDGHPILKAVQTEQRAQALLRRVA